MSLRTSQIDDFKTRCPTERVVLVILRFPDHFKHIAPLWKHNSVLRAEQAHRGQQFHFHSPAVMTNQFRLGRTRHRPTGNVNNITKLGATFVSEFVDLDEVPAARFRAIP